eukprot:760467-Hanusia_phi.AAC.5
MAHSQRLNASQIHCAYSAMNHETEIFMRDPLQGLTEDVVKAINENILFSSRHCNILCKWTNVSYRVESTRQKETI